MAKRRRRRPRSVVAEETGASGVATADRAAEKRAHREEARRRRDALQRTFRRRRLVRRAVVWGAVALAVVVAGAYVVSRELESRALRREASSLAAAAGCTDVVEQPDQGAGHLAAGQPATYLQRPATSGTHDSAPLPPTPRVYEQPVPEQNAVHNLEHGYVLVYFRQDGDGALPGGVVSALADLVEGTSKVVMAPYPGLGPEHALALVAWNELQRCPSTVTPSQAVGLARAFIDRFRSGGQAPEPSAP